MLNLFTPSKVFLSVDQNAGVVHARGNVIRRELQSGFKQQFRVIQNTELVLDSGKQPQCLDIAGGLEQIGPEDALRGRQIAIREPAAGMDDLRRQLFQGGEALGRGHGIC